MSADEAVNAVGGEDGRAARTGRRVESLTVLVVAGAVLALAWILQPSPRGYGTHEQLFVIPCAFRWLTNLPCPMCGMTTAFALMARGQVLTALSAHVLGPALYLATWGMAGSAVAGLIRGRRPLPRWLGGPQGARVTLAVVAVGWLANLAIHLLGA
jgi:hypothetical protein